jgi:Tfp pilus assembly protein FimV
VQANPSAFRSGNPNWLIAGREIRVPTADDVLALIFVTPPKSINESTKNWVKYP